MLGAVWRRLPARRAQRLRMRHVHRATSCGVDGLSDWRPDVTCRRIVPTTPRAVFPAHDTVVAIGRAEAANPTAPSAEGSCNLTDVDLGGRARHRVHPLRQRRTQRCLGAACSVCIAIGVGGRPSSLLDKVHPLGAIPVTASIQLLERCFSLMARDGVCPDVRGMRRPL